MDVLKTGEKRLKVLKTRTVYEGKTKLIYNLIQDENAYGLEIKAYGEKQPYIYADDITRDLNKAIEIFDLFADNTVFPQNALEVFDDLLGVVI